MVSYLEWTILGDLPRLASAVPDELTASALAGKSTGQIAGRLNAAGSRISDEAVRTYIERAGQLLGEAAELRNDVLHARPGTSPEDGQRLYRWKAADQRGPARTFFIDTAWLEKAIDQLSEASRALSGVRVTGRTASGPG